MLRFLDQILEFTTKFISSQRIQSLIKISPFLIIPILIYILGQQYLEDQDSQSKMTIENNRISMLIEANEDLRMPLSQYILRSKGGFNERKFNDFIRVLNIMNRYAKEYSRKSINDTFEFFGYNRKYHGSPFEQRIASDYFRSLAAQNKINSTLFSIMVSNASKYEDDGIDRITELLLSEEFIEGPNCNDLKVSIGHFFDVHKVRKSKRKIILPCAKE